MTRKASRITATVLGLFAGGASVEHGVYEILRGNLRPEGLMIASMGPPCQPEAVWHNCEPAMTILPNFLITGILAVTIGVFFMLWSLAFVQRRGGGLVMILTAVPMLLFGGGIFPPLIGILGGIVGIRLHRAAGPSRAQRPGMFFRLLAWLWPWALIFLAAWLLGQWLVGYYFNDFLMGTGFFIPIFIVGLLALSLLSAVAHDRVRQGED
jgi:hypothetical protein